MCYKTHELNNIALLGQLCIVISNVRHEHFAYVSVVGYRRTCHTLRYKMQNEVNDITALGHFLIADVNVSFIYNLVSCRA